MTQQKRHEVNNDVKYTSLQVSQKSLVLVKNIINGRYVRCSNKMQKSDFLYVSLIFEILKLPSTIPHDPLLKKRKNKFYENKIKLNWLNLLHFFFVTV